MPKTITNADILEAINDFRKEMKECYVTLDRYSPVEKLVYGMAGMILLAVVGGLVSLVVSKTGVKAIW